MHLLLRAASIALLTSVAACRRGGAPAPAGEPPAASKELVVDACDLSVRAPAGFDVAKATERLEKLRLVDARGARASVFCLRKIDTAPTTLRAHAKWLVEAAGGEREDPAPVEWKDGPALDGHASLRADAAATPGRPRTTFLLAERPSAFFWLRWTPPNDTSDEAALTALASSLRVTKREADRSPTRWWHPPLALDARTLAAARASFHTRVPRGRPAKGFDGRPPRAPPKGIFDRVDVKGPAGRLATYVTPDPKDGKRHPAVVWAHGGFGGIDDGFWTPAPRSNDQSAKAFREAGIIMVVGSWRAENDNPGDYELYYGEVDDYLATRDYAASLPYVDPDRIYLAGHSSGGALVLLAAEKTDAFRAAFSIGGVPAFGDTTLYDRYGGVPFDAKDPVEVRLRSAAPFVLGIRRPTFYFEGRGNPGFGTAQWMEDRALEKKVPFSAHLAMPANHFSLVAPITELLAKKIVADVGPTTNIAFTQGEIDALKIAEP